MVLSPGPASKGRNIGHILAREDQGLLRRLSRLSSPGELHRNLRRLCSHGSGKHDIVPRSERTTSHPGKGRSYLELNVQRCCRGGLVQGYETRLLRRVEPSRVKGTALPV